MARDLVTGGAGFIGSHLADALLQAGRDVTVLDDLSTGKPENLPDHPKLTFVEGSICDPDAVARAMDGVEVVYHEAALPSVPRSIDDPRTSCRINIEGTAVVLHAAHQAGVRRVVGAGSSSVYGNTPTLPKVETMPPAPLSPYAVSKLALEHLFVTFHRTLGLETVVLRYFNVFGPRQDPTSQYAAVIPIFLDALLAGNSPTINGDGEQSRDFTFVANVVHANRLAADAPKAPGNILNVACGSRHSLNRMTELLIEYAGVSVAAAHGPDRAGDVKHSQADITRARERIGFEPCVQFEEGLLRTVQWRLNQKTG